MMTQLLSIHLPQPKSLLSPPSQGRNHSGADRLTDKTHHKRRNKGIVLDDTNILGFMKEAFIAEWKAFAKLPADRFEGQQ
jgi:hypothetical protein